MSKNAISPHSGIGELETADSPEITARSAREVHSVQGSTPRSSLWPPVLSFMRLMRFTSRSRDLHHPEPVSFGFSISSRTQRGKKKMNRALRKNIFLFFAFLAITGPWFVAQGKDLSPVISDLNLLPVKGPAGTVFTITLRIMDPQGADDLERTLFQMREGRESSEIAIHDDGLNGDISKGDDIYTGKDRVPETAAKAAHRFEVFVQDKSGHRSNLLEYTFTVLEGVVIRGEGLARKL